MPFDLRSECKDEQRDLNGGKNSVTEIYPALNKAYIRAKNIVLL